jgi:hypothetical protein
MTDDEPLIIPNQIPPECIKTFEELSGLGATPEEILAGVLNAWPGAEYIPGRKLTKTWTEPSEIILPLKEPRT